MAEEKEKREADEKEKKKADAQEAAPKKSILKWIALGVLLIMLGAGGFFGWRMFSSKDDQKGIAETAVVETGKVNEKESLKITCPLESFVVNLMDKTNLGKRYLKITIVLEVDNEPAKEKIAKYQPHIKDTVLMLLTSQSFDEISTMEGKLDLKKMLLTRINQAVGEGLVRRIYFTEFVIQ